MLTVVVCGEAGPGTVIDITCDVDEDCAEFENRYCGALLALGDHFESPAQN